MYHDIGADDMLYSEFVQMVRSAWSDKFNFLCIDITKSKNEGKYRIFNERNITNIECISAGEPF